MKSIPAPAPNLHPSLAMMNSRSISGGTTKPVTLKFQVVSKAKTVRVFPITGRFRTPGACIGVMKASSVLKLLKERVFAVLTSTLNSSMVAKHLCELNTVL